ncbi:adaptin ear-binding coat-associated protein 1 NECAP-1 [Ascodesmis nigricans]|uniref:Adaptin ear-binding coat-associated protein 1 NECAP-1 n=1 Tax=Ascodesmis nigricans TaxID=341454 RepID=A0A4S2N0A3_9PEZI|nr:adaptin ear-binding coat-associated protein 1 NECAP-1 [Ascodesmis nigricans]
MADEIQRVLFVAPKVHVYAVPPLGSNSGYRASHWNVDGEGSRIFMARLRVIETATTDAATDQETIRNDVRLEDPKSGELFANCPYEDAFCVEQVVDSSRFFAIRVVHGPRKAILGIGFEDRSDAFEFGVVLQTIRRQNNMDVKTTAGASVSSNSGKPTSLLPEKKDYSLKEGETISVTIGNKGHRRTPSKSDDSNAAFALLPPPPSASDVKRRNRNTPRQDTNKYGFEDDFGDFQ